MEGRQASKQTNTQACMHACRGVVGHAAAHARREFRDDSVALQWCMNGLNHAAWLLPQVLSVRGNSNMHTRTCITAQ